MKKNVKKLVFLCIALSLSFASCKTTKTTAITSASISGSFVSADKYGNLETNLSVSALTDAGFELGDIVSIVAGEKTIESPIVSTYSDVNVGEYLIRLKDENVFVSINHGNAKKDLLNAVTFSFMLKEKGGYLTEYEIRHLTKSQNRSDFSTDEVFANFRMVTTSNIKNGILYRSCNPSLGDTRAPYADALAAKANIKTIVNLADNNESVLEHIDMAPWYKKMLDSKSVILLDMDVDFKSDEFRSQLIKGLSFMANREGPYLIHCNEGKDRAGFTSVVLEALTGASVQEITEDYMMSFENYFGVEKGTKQYASIAEIPVQMLDSITKDGASKGKDLKEIAQTFLRDSGMSEEAIQRLISNLSE